MAKKKWVLLFWVFSLLIFTTTGGVSAASMTDKLLPKQTENKDSSVELESGKYPLMNYGMDTEMEEEKFSDLLPWNLDETVGKSINGGLSTINSAIWKMNAIMSSLTIAIIHEAYTADIVGQFGNQAGELIKDITGVSNYGFSGSGLWATFLYSLIIFSVAWLGFRVAVQRQATVAISGLLSIMLILGISIGFFTFADKILGKVNDVTNAAQNMTLNYATGAVTDQEFENTEGMATMKNQLFNTMIKNPWLLMQFGTIDQKAIENEWKKKGSRIDTILKTGPYTEERQEAVKYEVKELKNENMTTGALLDRFVVLLFVFAANSVLGVFTTLLTGSMVIYSVMVLIYAMYTVLTLLISIIPKFQNTGLKSIGKLAHAFYMKVGLAFLCTINFAFMNWIYSWVKPDMGMLLVYIYQIVIVTMIFLKRKELLNIINSPFNSLKVNNERGLDINNYKNMFETTKKNALKLSKPFVQSDIKTGLSAFGKIKSNPGVGVVGHGPIYKNLKSVNELKTGTMATKESSNASGSEIKTGGKAPNVAKNVPNAANPVQNAGGKAPNVSNEVATGPASQSNSNKVAALPNQKQDLKVSERPKGTEYGPSLQDDSNLRSLEKTLDKGGFAHKVKDSGEIKTGERQIKIHDWKEERNGTEQK